LTCYATAPLHFAATRNVPLAAHADTAISDNEYRLVDAAS